MERLAIVERVRQIVSFELDIELHAVQLETRLVDDLGCDERALIELSLTFEEEFGLELSDAETRDFVTVSDTIACIQARLDRLRVRSTRVACEDLDAAAGRYVLPTRAPQTRMSAASALPLIWSATWRSLR